MENLEGKVAIVTGASKGIGAEIARAMTQAGAQVIVNYFSDKSGAEAVVQSIEENGGTAIAVQADVTSLQDVKKLFKVADQTYGALDILVNNAGVYTFEPVEVVTEKEYHRQFDHNVFGVLFTIQEALHYFTQDHGGTIINISSVASVMPTSMSVIYSATKSAVDAITKTLAKELGAKNIKVNSILPGPTHTEGNQIIGSSMEEYIISNTPLGRIGQPIDIAALAVFLASEKASWITGQKIVVSGGFE